MVDMSEASHADLVAFANRRADRGGMYRSWCSGCGCSMKIDAKTLAEEFAGAGPLCHACRPGCAAPYGGSPQSRHDNVYHGGRYHSAEWEG
jgi:hypothetical protein